MADTYQNKEVKKARKKFVVGAVAATFAAVLLLVISINLVRFVQVTSRQEEIVNSLLAERKEDSFAGNKEYDRPYGEQNINGLIRNGRKGGRGSVSMQYSGRFFEIIAETDGTVILNSKNAEALTESEAKELSLEIVSEGKESGYRDDYRYVVKTRDDGAKIISLLDCTEDSKSLSDLCIITIAVGLLGTLIAFFFILFISRKAIAPLVDSMEKQKRFVTDAGHELKTPLSVINTNMDILAMDLGENEWVDGTKRQVDKLKKLVNNMVYLSKMDEQETILSPVKFSISEAAFECVDLYRLVADAAGKRLEPSIEEGLYVTADENSIKQVLSILLDNAIKYAEGDHVINVTLRSDGNWVLFETENDWAKNIDSDKLDSVFNRFTRGDRSRSGADGKNGFGLGLSIAKSVSEKNHSSLDVCETKEGKLKFTLKLSKLF